MPLNTLRLNHAPSSHPNDRIVFIKPLPRPPSQANDYQTADTLLRAIAAQCLPIMKSHYLSVTTLEEHEPNPEFIGRNFNNGEIIQLVLRGKHGGWLPINMIQMVMMHELAHNTHMNHGKQFWIARNLYAGEMRALWAKGYTGEGLWGSGRTLRELGQVMGGSVLRSEELKDLPVCGGTFRSRRRKRRAKGNTDGLTWKEKKERRIEKKFGKNGVALGEEEDKRLSLELSGKGPVGVKPRVAQSKRGRELRAAAALARFDTNKKEVEELDGMKKEDDETQSEDDYEDVDGDQEDALDTNGRRLLDNKGQTMIKVCEEEEGSDFNVKQEMEELEGLDFDFFTNSQDADTDTSKRAPAHPRVNNKSNGNFKSLYDIPQHQEETSRTAATTSTLRSKSDTNSEAKTPTTSPSPSSSAKTTPTTKTCPPAIKHPAHKPTLTDPQNPSTSTSTSASSTPLPPPAPMITTITCPICSLTNPRANPTCLACSHVLDGRKDPRAWSCSSDMCNESVYLNSGDVGVCGICGVRRGEGG